MAFVLLLGATGCGARQVVDPTVAARGAAANASASANPVEAEAGTASDTAGTATLDAGTNAATSAGASTATGTGRTTGAAAAAASPQRSANVPTGKTDVGVTRDTILLGNVTALSGPLPGQFDGMPNGTQAFIAKYNAEGGFRGRKLKLVIRDDGLDPNKHRAAVVQLVEEDKVFALLNDGTVVHGASADYLKAKNIPVVSGSAFDNTYCVTPNFFSINTYCPHESQYGQWIKWAADHGIKKIAFLYVNLGITQSLALALKKGFKDYGLQLVFEREVQLAEADYTPYIIAARSAGADTAFTLIDNASSINMLKAMKRQNWNPPLYLQAAEDDVFIRQVKKQGLSLEGMVTPGGPLTSEPSQREYVQTYKAAFPDEPVNSFSSLGWQGIKWFTDVGLARMGPDITRAALMHNLVTSTGWTADGMMAPLVIGPVRHPQKCSTLITVRNGELARLHPGYLCDAPYIKF